MLLAKDLHLILLYMVETCDYFNTFYFLTAVFLFCKAHLISCYCRTGLDEVSQLLCFSFLFFSLSIYMAYPWSFYYFSSWNFYLRTVIWFELTELRIKQIIDTSWSNSIVNQHVYMVSWYRPICTKCISPIHSFSHEFVCPVLFYTKANSQRNTLNNV